jgi:hypothetical protein
MARRGQPPTNTASLEPEPIINPAGISLARLLMGQEIRVMLTHHFLVSLSLVTGGEDGNQERATQ